MDADASVDVIDRDVAGVADDGPNIGDVWSLGRSQSAQAVETVVAGLGGGLGRTFSPRGRVIEMILPLPVFRP